MKRSDKKPGGSLWKHLWCHNNLKQAKTSDVITVA